MIAINRQSMIFKYALFTLAVSIIPLVMIIKDLEMPYNSLITFNTYYRTLNFDFVNEVLSSGIISYVASKFTEDIGSQHNTKSRPNLLFTKDELQAFDGKQGNPMYLAILGNVFDVSKASKYYGPGETYNVFTGRDGSRAFITGDFTEEGLTDNVEDLNAQELRSLNDWLKFYRKEYVFKGKLIGRYYDNNGKPTGNYHKLQLRIEEANKDEQDKNKYKLMYPPCNMEWTPEEGSRVWCSTKSGGIERDWVGVPRKLHEPGASTYRCACINPAATAQVIAPETGKSRTGNLEEYEDCHPKSSSCYVHS